MRTKLIVIAMVSVIAGLAGAGAMLSSQRIAHEHWEMIFPIPQCPHRLCADSSFVQTFCDTVDGSRIYAVGHFERNTPEMRWHNVYDSIAVVPNGCATSPAPVPEESAEGPSRWRSNGEQ